MDAIEKVYFIFNAFDFDSRGSLSNDEANLLFRSVTKGLNKISVANETLAAVTSSDAEKFADLVFSAMDKPKETGRVSIDEFKAYSVSHPIVSNWLKSVAALEVPGNNNNKGVVEEKERDGWVSTLNGKFKAARVRARLHALQLEDIDIQFQESTEQKENDDVSVTSSVDTTPAWIPKVGRLKPEEIPAQMRSDLPEDVFEPLWIGGINARRISSTPCSFAQAQIHRSARYRSVASDVIVYSAGTNIVSIKKNEETQLWAQEVFSEHQHPVSCFDVNYSKSILVSADKPINNIAGKKAVSRIVVWDVATFKVKNRIEVPHGVKFLDVNTSGTHAVALSEDTGNTLTVIDLQTGKAVYSKKVTFDTLGDYVNDVRFFGSSNIIAVACEKQGIRFFINEESGVMGKNNMQLYEERIALYGAVGKAAKGSATTVLTRLEFPDELACGTDSGHIVVWRGRTVSQLIEAHRGKLTSLDYDPVSKTLVSAGEDGTVKLYEIRDPAASSSSGLVPKGPRPPSVRTIVESASFDILRHNLAGYKISSITISDGAKKVIVVTSSNELLELTCKVAPPSGEEVQEAAEGGEGDAIPASTGKIGDDLHGGALASGHFIPDDAATTQTITNAVKVGNGFATCGSDATVRLWNPVGEGDTGVTYKLVKTIKMDCPCSAITSSGSTLAVALSGEGSVRTGSIHLFALPDGTFVTELTECKSTIIDLKMSPESNLVVASSVDGSIYVYGSAEGVWSLKGKLSAGGEVAESMDLSADNQFLRVYYSTSKDLKVFELGANFGNEIYASLPPPAEPKPVAEGEEGEPAPVPGAAIIETLKGIQWAANNCPYNWDNVGVNSLLAARSMIANIYDRSNHLLVCSVDDGTVDVSRVPSLNAGLNQQRKVACHNGPLASLSFFDEGGVKLLTAGGLDGNLRVWKVNYDVDEFEFDLPEPVVEEGEVKQEEEGEEGNKALPILYDSGDEDDLEDGKKLKLHLKRDLSGTSVAEKVLGTWCSTFENSDNEDLSRFAAKSLNSSAALLPNDELEVEWVYGCSSRQTRNAVRYTTDGHIVYPAGSVPIVFDKVNRKQTLVHPHKDEITCLDVHVSKNLAVTAHKGVGSIYAYIWKTNDGKVLKVIDCGKVGGVSAVKFSPDASLLIVSCQDADHTVMVFNVEDGCLLAKTRGGAQKVLCLAFSDVPAGSTYRILQGGVKHYKLLSYQSNLQTIQSKTGAYGADVRKSNVNCVSSLPMAVGEGDSVSGNEFILGMGDGSIGVVARGESKVSGFTPTMKGAITAICVARIKAATAEEPPVFKVVVGGVNGFIKVLDQELQPISEFNLYVKDYGLYPFGRVRGFKSLCVDKLNRKILFGTAAGEVGEIDLATGEDLNQSQPIIHSHFRDQLNALAAHPLRPECLTAGEDKTLRIWNLETHTQTAILELPGPAISGAFAPNGHLIVVSLAKKNTDPFGGRLAIVSFLQGKIRIVHTTNDAREEIVSVAFSPDGSKVYAGSMDSTIYVYDALNNFQMVNTLNGHSEGVKSVDISEDGRYLVSESILNHVVLWDIRTSSQISRPSEVFETLGEVDRNYHTRQNIFGLNSIGVISTDKQACDVLSLAQSRDKRLLVVGDQNGQLKLFSNPATSLNAPFRNYNIHTPGGLSKIAFTVGDQSLLTVGRYDKILIQWKLTSSEAQPDAVPSSSGATKNIGADDPFDASFAVKGVDFRNDDATTVAHKHIVSQLTNIVGAGNHNAGLLNLPSALFCGHGEIITVVGKTVAVSEGDSNRKTRVWNTNTITPLAKHEVSKMDVSSVAVSPSGRFVIVGYLPSESSNNKAPVHLYHAPTGDFLLELVAEAEGGISNTSFSKDSSLAAVISRDAQHTMHVFKTFNGHWNDATLLHQTHTSAGNINQLAFLISPDSPISNANDLVTAGDGHIKFWKVNNLNLRCETGNYGEPKYAAITAVVGGMGNGARDEAITGDADGKVYMWRGKFRSMLIESHPSAVTAMTSYGSSDGLKAGFIAASKGTISIWSTSNNIFLMHQITMENLLNKLGWSSSLYTRDVILPTTLVRSMTSDPECRQVIMSLNNGVVASLSTDSGNVRKLFESHGSNNTVRQLACHPSIDSLAITVAEDSALRLWDLSGDSVYSGVSLKKTPPAKSNAANLVGHLVLPHSPTAVEFFNDNTLFVAISGTDQDGVSGAVLVVDMQKNDVKGEAPYRFTILNRLHNIGQGSIRHLRISPQNKYLACGSDDGCIYIHKIGDGSFDSDSKFEPVGFFLAHTFGAPVVGVDFSADNRYVRSFGPNNAFMNGKVEVNFFDFELPGGDTPSSTNPLKKFAGAKIQDVGAIESMKTTKWGSISSPAAPEVRGLSFTAEDDVDKVLHVESLSVSHDGSLVAAGYRDGLIRVFK